MLWLEVLNVSAGEFNVTVGDVISEMGAEVSIVVFVKYILVPVSV